jgi:hypothetical protein
VIARLILLIPLFGLFCGVLILEQTFAHLDASNPARLSSFCWTIPRHFCIANTYEPMRAIPAASFLSDYTQ